MTQRRNSSLAVWLILAAMLLPVSYVLSFGPAVRLHDAGYLPSAVRYFYAPLMWAAELWPPCASLLRWYVGLWGG